MKIERVAVVDGHAVVYLQGLEKPLIVFDGQELKITIDQAGMEMLWFVGLATKVVLAQETRST